MYATVRKFLLSSLSVSMLCSMQPLLADQTWIGFEGDLTKGSNWSGGSIPSSTELGLFKGDGATQPFLNFGSSSSTLDVGGIQFSGTPVEYQFSISGQDPISVDLIIENQGVNNSVLGASAVDQKFFLNTGTIHFNNGSSDVNSTGKVFYIIFPPTLAKHSNSVSSSFFSSIFYNNAAAGKSQIAADGSFGAAINFQSNSDAQSAFIQANNTAVTFDTSSAGDAQINLTSNSTLNFANSATAGNAQINLSNTPLSFTNSATPGNATINVDNCSITSNSIFTNSTAQFTLSNHSSLQIENNLFPGEIYNFSIGALNTDLTSPTTLDNFSVLTLSKSSTIAGVINGGNSKLVINMSNPQDIVKLTGTTNTYSGGTSIESGILDVSLANLPLSPVFNSINGTLRLEQNINQTFIGTIVGGTGVIQINGPGALTVNAGVNNFKGTTEVNGSHLIILGLLGGNVTNNGGIVSGVGTIGGNLNNSSGTVKPGSSIGTLTVNGNFTQGFSGVYEAELNSAGQSDLLDIRGTATLAGTLSIVTLNGVQDLNQTFTILHADGGIEGVFTFVTANVPNLVPHVTYTHNDVLVNFEHLLVALSNTHNQEVVADQLATIDNPILTQLIALGSSPSTIDQTRLALSQMSGEQYTNTLLTNELANRQFLRRLYDPLRPLLTDLSCCQDCYGCNPWEFNNATCSNYWFQIGGGHTSLRHDQNAGGFKTDSFEGSIGIQAPLNRSWTLGLAAGYQHDNIHYNQVGGKGKNNIGLLGAYALYRPSCGYYFLGDAVFSFNLSKITRPIDIDDQHFKAHGKPNAYQWTFYGESGANINCHWLQVQPFFGLEVDCYLCNKFKEHGADIFNLHVHTNGHVQAFSRLGVHLTALNICQYLSFNLDLAWQCRLSHANNRIKERFIDFGDSFTIYGVSVPRNSLEATLNSSVHLGDRCSLFLELTGQRWERLHAYNLTAGVLVDW